MNNILYHLRKKMPVLKTSGCKKIVGISAALIACATLMQSHGQQSKSPLQLADQYFAAGEYYTAANLYEQFLNPSRKQRSVSEFPLNIKARRLSGPTIKVSRTAILFKQAQSYRLANYWRE